jgi:hypothetical protein
MIDGTGLVTAASRPLNLVAATAFACLLALTPVAAQAGDAASDIAEKFARDADQKVRSEAAQAKRELARQKSLDDQRKSEEAEMLATARREADDRKRAEALAEKSGTPVRVQIDGHDLQEQRKLELDRVAAKLRMAREAREAKVAADAKRAAETARIAAGTAAPLPAPGQTAATKPMERDTFWTAEVNKEPSVKPDIDTSLRSALGGGALKLMADTKVTVLMVLAPGNKGIRRFEKTADPVLCTQEHCYISQGAASAAIPKPLHKALGPGNTFGRRAGACNHALGCVFRGVEIGAGENFLQPVDLKVLVHDQRARQPLVADGSCRMASGSLVCSKPLVAEDYKLWVVPESVANDAGSDALARAIANGLSMPYAADTMAGVKN